MSENNSDIQEQKKRQKKSLKNFLIYGFIGMTIIIPLVLFLTSQPNSILYTSVVAITGYFLIYLIRSKPQKVTSLQCADGTDNILPKEILSVIFAFVAGFAITQAISQFSDGIDADTNSHILGLSLQLISFFSIAIPFFHASLSILKEHKELQHHQRLIFVMFLVLFVNAIIIYLIGINLQKMNSFVMFISALALFNAIWLIIQSGLIGYAENSGERQPMSSEIKKLNMGWLVSWYKSAKKDLPIKSWIPMHLVTFSFLFFSFLPYIQHNSKPDLLQYFLLFCVLVSRTTFDYMIGWGSVYGNPLHKKNNESFFD